MPAQDNSRFPSARFACSGQALHCASLSLRESEAPVGMTIIYFLELRLLSFDLLLIFNLFDGVGVGEVELGNGGAAKRFEMGSGTKALAHFVGDGAHVGSRGYTGAEVGAAGIDFGDDEFFNLDFHGLQNNFFLLSRQFVGGDAVDFLGGKWWRDLLD